MWPTFTQAGYFKLPERLCCAAADGLSRLTSPHLKEVYVVTDVFPRPLVNITAGGGDGIRTRGALPRLQNV